MRVVEAIKMPCARRDLQTRQVQSVAASLLSSQSQPISWYLAFIQTKKMFQERVLRLLDGILVCVVVCAILCDRVSQLAVYVHPL